MTKGENITVFVPTIVDEDEYGDSIENWEPVEVSNALVYELAGSDLVDADRPDGTKIKARIQIPDAVMEVFERKSLKGCRVALCDRGQNFNDSYWVVGEPNYAPNLPTAWNTTIEVGRANG